MKKLPAALVLISVFCFAGVIYAQQTDDMRKITVLTGGDYRDVNFLRAMKLGTAPFVNPALLEQASVAYKYDPTPVVDSEDWPELVEKVAAGKVGLGVQMQDGYFVAAPDDPAWLLAAGIDPGWEMIDSEKLAQILAAAIGKQKIVLISYDDRLLDKEPVGKVVSWKKGEPLMLNYEDASHP